MKLQKITNSFSIITGPVNIGVILLEKSRVALIDSGLHSNYGAKVYELLSDYRFKISYILNSHAHADHIGGNAYIQKKTGCQIFASQLEAPLIRQPLIQAAVLFAGPPIPDLTNKFIMAEPSKVEILNNNQCLLKELEIETIELAGHSINQKGFKIGNVAFVADAIFPESFFKKQRLPFVYDPFAQLDTLETLRNTEAEIFTGGHFAPTSSIGAMIETNFSSIRSGLSFMRKLLQIPQPQDRIIKAFMDHFKLRKTGWEHFLYRTMVNGYLSALYKHKEINFRIMDNLLVWYAT
ncbi:MAG: MBL fold metallo-hydrolase [Candidatus Rifleibacteriota bacterium]